MLSLKEESTPSTPASGYVRVYAKSDGRVYAIDDAGTEVVLNSTTTLGTPQATTSGTSKDFSIPSGVKRVTVMLSGVSTNGTSKYHIRVGSAVDGIKSSGYLVGSIHAGSTNTVGGVNPTAGFEINGSSVDLAIHGKLTLDLMDASTNTWVATGVFGNSAALFTFIMGGSVSLSSELNQIRLTTANGTDTFDAGSVNVSYEF